MAQEPLAAAPAPRAPMMVARASSARDFAAGLVSEAAFLPRDALADRGSVLESAGTALRLSELHADELHAAVLRGDLRALADCSGDVDALDATHGVTALLLAAGKGKLPVVEALLARGANPSRQSGKHRMTPLHGAAKSGHAAVMTALLDAGSNVDALDGTGCTALYWAARKGHVAAAELLLARGADPEATGSDWRPLHIACANDSVEVVALLLARGAQVNAAMEFGITPLDFAASQGSPDVARLLLDAGADVNNRDEKTATTPLHRAAIRGDWDLVTLLVGRGARVDAETFDRATPLFAAAEYGHLEVVQYLMDADPDWRQHSSPVHAVASNGHLDVLDHLVSAGVDVDLTNAFDVTPLCAAVLSGKLPIMGYLLANGADVGHTMKDDRAFTYLHFAAENGDEEAVRLLAESGADVDARDEFGYTPLHIAAVHGAVTVVEALLESGADLYAEGLDGLTVTDVAAASGQLRVLQYLQEHGFVHDLERPHPSDPKVTPLSLAAADGHPAVVRYLVELQDQQLRLSNVGGGGSDDQATAEAVHALELRQREARYDALISAVESDHLDVVAFLCEVGAHDGMLEARDTTPLHTAAGLGRTLVAEFLLQEQHASLAARTTAGLTALHVAATTGQAGMLKLLLAFGAAVNERVERSSEADLVGMTPLHFAALFGHLDVLRVLVRHGADLDALTEQGAGALECAKEGDNAQVIPHIIDFLLAHGAIEKDATAANVRTCCFGWF
ncbi:hypothetical protein PybrP1_003467 [[Pythium] brassicae (nom. inval.)]|nr:hypothetical protein PybrP1_003467 [[Pythium] brassicae (nom. inval.)]